MKAVQMSPEALQGMVILATIDLLDDKTTTWMDQALKINPKYGEGYATIGHFFVINRRYREGIEYYRKAVATDPQLWSARSQLGIELMRFGKNDEARQNLEAAFDAGYKDPATTNTLRLMDTYKNYETFTTPTTVLKLQKKEAALLRPYFQEQLDKAMAVYEKKYKFKLKEPVQIEVYPAHEDFAVRTMGMPGLGALGVTFGQVVAMDSPSGRKPGDFHWASTMWHELSHVYVLAMTDHRVPRWFTEAWRCTRKQRRSRIGATGWITNPSRRLRKRSCCRSRSSTGASFIPAILPRWWSPISRAAKFATTSRRSMVMTRCWP